MDFKVLGLLFLFALAIGQAGCATTRETYDDTTPGPDNGLSHEDDSNGWGANLQSAH
jgi:hypothetical protein